MMAALTASAPRRIQRSYSGLLHTENRIAWLFLAPYLVGFLAFILFPLIFSLLLVFMRYDVFSPPTFVGFENITAMLQDQRFWRAWRVTLIYSVIGVAYSLILGLVFGLTLFHVKRGRGFWRMLYYLPSLLAGTAEALMQGVIWNPEFGLINAALSLFGIQGPYWLQDSNWALPALILMRYWSIGSAVLFFLGARSSISPDLYEAAAIDGASGWTIFRRITLPMLTPIILFNLILGIIGAIQGFGQIFVLTAGGPAGATQTITIYLYFRAFRDLQMGYASALSWSVFLVAISFSLLLLYTARRWVYYETGDDRS